MSAYIFISDSDKVKMSSVDDKDVNALFKEASEHDPSLLIEQRTHVTKKWFSETIEQRFSVYHESPAFDGSAYQARYSMCGSGSKDVVIAYLYGIINGSFANQRLVR